MIDERKIVVLLGHKDHPPQDTQFIIASIKCVSKVVITRLHRILNGQIDSTCDIYAPLDSIMSLREFKKWEKVL